MPGDEPLVPEADPGYFDGKSLGQVAYEAYFDSCDGLSITGAILPPWVTVPGHIKSHWHQAAARTARVGIARYREEVTDTP
jgi:hypothetical protein